MRPDGDPRAVLEGRPQGRRRAGWAAVAVALACALAVLGADLLQSVASGRSVAPFLVALGLALIPVPLLVAVVLLLDRLEPEPRRNLVFAFAWGAGVAALVAAVINTAGLIFVTEPDLGKSAGQYVSATFGAPVVEETLKAMVLAWLLWRRRQELDGPTDGIIYAAMVGLGFAMIENVGYYLGALARPRLGGIELLGVTFVFRGLLTPFAHPIFTSMTGLGAARAARRGTGSFWFWAGLLGAMILHGVWNGLLTFGLAGIAIAYTLLGCVLCCLIAVVVADRRRIVRLVQRFLPRYQAQGLIGAGDVLMLSSLRARRQARQGARRAGGRAAARHMTEYQLAATELALAHQRAEQGAMGEAEFGRRRRDLTRLMAAARGLPPPPAAPAP